MSNEFEKQIAQTVHTSLQKADSVEEEAYVLATLVKILTEKKALNYSDRIITAMKEILDQEEHIITAKVTVAEPLSPDAVQSLTTILKERYSAKDVIIKEYIDSSILGGMKVMIGDEEYDATLKEKINKLAQHLQVTK